MRLECILNGVIIYGETIMSDVFVPIPENLDIVFITPKNIPDAKETSYQVARKEFVYGKQFIMRLHLVPYNIVR